jgi:hypothetical protein
MIAAGGTFVSAVFTARTCAVAEGAAGQSDEMCPSHHFDDRIRAMEHK